MDLWVIRHGLAVDRERFPADRPDAERPLTKAGAERVRLVADALGERGVRFDVLLFSPWRRALETADLLAPLVDGRLTVTSSLRTAPGPQLLDELDGERCAVVGHEPWLGELIGLLVFGDPLLAEGLRLGKAGVAHLRGLPHPGGMVLRALDPARTWRTGRG